MQLMNIYKCLSIVRYRYQDPYLQPFLGRRICKMSNTQEDTPQPIGSFVLNPLMVKKEEKTKEYDFEESKCTNKTTIVKEKKVSDRSDNENDMVSNVIAMDTNLDHAKESKPENQHEKPYVTSVPIKPLFTGKSKVSGKTVLTTESGDIPGTSSSLMMKLAVSGPPKCKFDEKKTVLPVSLLQGVTELVKRQQVKDFNRRTSDDSSERQSIDSEGSVSTGDAADVGKRISNTEKKISKDEKQIHKKTDNHPMGDESNIQKTKENQVTYICSENRTVPFGNDNANNVPCQDIPAAKSSKSLLSYSEKDKEIQVTGSTKQKSLNHQDLFVSAELQKNCSTLNVSSSEMAHEDNPFCEVDLEGLINDDAKHLNGSTDLDREENCIDGSTVSNVEQSSKELRHTDKRKKKEDKELKKSQTTKDNIYDLSVLFSGVLEQRRKKELKKQKRKAKNFERFSKGKKKSSSSDNREKQPEPGEQEEKPRKPVPNYFVAIQIKDTQIISGLKSVQDKVVAENIKLKPALNKLATLHLTLQVLCLKTVEDMERSKQALDRASEKLLSLYTDVSLTLDVSGLGHFRNNVVFAKVKHEQQVSTLQQVADIVEECFLEQEIISPDQRGFKPHITIMKLSSVKGPKKKGLKKIDEKLYSEFIDTDFGCESIHTLQLCAMMKPKDKQGYYQVEHKVKFAKVPDSVEMSDELDEKSEMKDNTKIDIEIDIETVNNMDTNMEVGNEIENKTKEDNENDKNVHSEDENIVTGNLDLHGIDNTRYNDNALDLSVETDKPAKLTPNITPEDDSALDVSGDTEMSEVISEPLSEENDSAFDMYKGNGTVVIVSKDTLPVNDSILDKSGDVEIPKEVSKDYT